MAVAGIAWGIYSLRGRLAESALTATANSFLFSVPLIVAVSLFSFKNVQASPQGVGLAVASGVVASGLGYVVWFSALRGLTAARAATVQLSVPIIAAFGCVALLSENVTARLLIASAATLGGIWMVLSQRVKATDIL